MNGLLSTVLIASMIISPFSEVLGFADTKPEAAQDSGHIITSIADTGTRDIDFNDNWKFYLATRTPAVGGTTADGSTASRFVNFGLADAGSYTTAQIVDNSFDDSSWRTVSVPHDFSIEGPKDSSSTDSNGYLQGGLGYYRKTFTLPKSMQDSQKRIIIDFQGVYQDSDVYVNGKKIGNYPNGYTGFAYDITDSVNYGDNNPNVITVKVQNMAPSGRWYTGSGIIRPVTLMVTDPMRFVRNGITLTSPDLETTYNQDGSGVLKVEAQTYSDSSNSKIQLKTSVIDEAGNVVSTNTTDAIPTNPSTSATLTDSITVPNVKLWYPWNIGDPYVYNVRTELIQTLDGGDPKTVDKIDTQYGFRWFKVNAVTAGDATTGGLYINGKYTKVQGVDLHHDAGALGAADNLDANQAKFQELKSMGVNAYRTSHCPPAKSVIDLCSRMGIIVMEESFDGWGKPKAAYDFGNFFLTPVPDDWAGLSTNGLSQLPAPGVNYSGAKYLWSDWVIREMISRDKNEACVLLWSIGNEVRGCGTQPSWYQPAQYNKANVATPTKMTEYTEAVRLGEDVKTIDKTRLVVMGGDQQRKVPSSTAVWAYVNKYLDGFGLNYNTAASVDGLISAFPTTSFFESESSSMTSSRGVYLDPSLSNTGTNYTPGKLGGSNYDNDFASWTMSNEYGLKKDRDRKAFLGQFIWSGFDYLGEPTPYSQYPVGVSSFGCIDTAGFKKDSFYLYQSQWTTNPMVHLLPQNWNNRHEGETVEVWAYSNQQSAELFLNGKSLGKKSFDEKTTAYGKKYYETSEPTVDDKTWLDSNNAGGYSSKGAVVTGSSTNYGKLHLTWKVPYEKGTLEVKAYDKDGKTVASDAVTSSKAPYKIEMKASKNVLKADGKSLTYVECSVVDEDGNIVPDANNLVKFDTANGAIVGVDNGQQENTELYKWGNVERNTHSERTAYMGKVLVILQSDKDKTGTMNLKVSSSGLQSSSMNFAVTSDGKGSPAEQPMSSPVMSKIETVQMGVPVGVIPTLPSVVNVDYDDSELGSYTVKKSVTWDAIKTENVAKTGIISVSGKVNGINETAKAVIYVKKSEDRTDIALNTPLGTNNQIFRFSDLPDDSMKDGALATASFTGSRKNLPNCMLDGDSSTSWTNKYSRGASVLLPAVSASRPIEDIEFFWNKTKIFNQIKLDFIIDTANAIPDTLNVQYWDGANWVDAKNQNVTKASVTNADTTIDFDAVTADKVRVNLYNATPYSPTGNMTITQASVMGWSLNSYAESGKVTSFDPLDSSVATQNVAIGTSIGSLKLPGFLQAVVDGISNAIIKVSKWVSDITYDPIAAGEYEFTPVLDSGYVLDSGAKLPKIKVKVESGAPANKTIQSFDSLPSSIASQTVGIGTKLNNKNLPESLNAVINGGKDTIKVTWQSNPLYQENVAGTYTFTAELPAGYALAKGVSLPQIIIRVKGKDVVTDKIITYFNPLPSSIALQTVSNGSELTSQNLPTSLNSIVDGKNGVIDGIKWESKPIYHSNIAGTYLFTAKLPDGYILADGVNLPTISIIVAKSDSNNNNNNNGHGSGNSSPSNNNTPVSNTPASEMTTTNVAGTTVTTFTAQPTSAPSVSGSKSSMAVTVSPDVMAGAFTATAQKPAQVSIFMPTQAIIEQLKNNNVKSVDLTINMPSSVINNSNPYVSQRVMATQAALQSAKDAQKDIVFKVVNSDTGVEAYTWTFAGSSLKNSVTSVSDVNLALSVVPVKNDSLASAVVLNNSADYGLSGITLKFGSNGLLPGPAKVRIYVGDQRNCVPNSKVYLYYLDSTVIVLKQMPKTELTVDANGYVTVDIVHCSEYVLLPKPATNAYAVKSDTWTTVGVRNSKTYTYAMTVSGNAMPSFTVGNNRAFTTTVKRSGNKYYVTVRAVGIAGTVTAVYSTLPGQKPVVMGYTAVVK
jgi:Beta-galactosidase/beta-glucuronidase